MNALLMGYYGGRNLGDDMMLHCIRQWLDAQHVRLTVLSEGAGDIRTRHGLPVVENVPLLGQWAWRDAWLRGKAARLLRAIARHDALIVGGGDLIRDDRGWRAFSFAVEKIVVALALRRQVFLVNIGIGTPSTVYGRWILRWILPRCARIIARDERTYELCRQLGAGAVAQFVPDIVLSLPRFVTFESGEASASRRYVLVCLRTRANDFSRFAWTDARISALAAGLDHLVQAHDLDVVFFPFQGMEGEQNDNRIHETVAERMASRSRVTIRRWTDDVGEVARAVRASQCVVAMRLHAAVLACALDRRCVLMPYDHKVAEFGRQAGILHEMTAETLESRDNVRRVLDAALSGGRERGAPAPTHAWDALTLAGAPAGPVTVGCP